ncbi:hypothetical protein Syun_015283 [Stephania yunnanensis]|uniref:Uncharacterized protein n=1 Tax=Stephania yunnanensis TaxID=152371 RepID=A0AAP0P982_9MAGN
MSKVQNSLDMQMALLGLQCTRFFLGKTPKNHQQERKEAITGVLCAYIDATRRRIA